MKQIILTICLLFTCVPAIAGGRHCGSCYYTPVYHAPAIEQSTTIVVEKQIIAPVRVIRYREIKGLRLVEDENGNTHALLGDKILNLTEGKTTSVVEAVKGTTLIERVITRVDAYGNKTITSEREISK